MKTVPNRFKMWKKKKKNVLMIFFNPLWCFMTSGLRFTWVYWAFTHVKTQRTHSVWKLQLNLPAIALRPQRQQETINQSWAFMAIHQMKPQGYLHRKSTWGSIRVFFQHKSDRCHCARVTGARPYARTQVKKHLSSRAHTKRQLTKYVF